MGLRHGLAIAILTTLACMLGRHVFILLGTSGEFGVVAMIWWFWAGVVTIALGICFLAVLVLGATGADIVSAWLKDTAASGNGQN